MKTNHNIIQNSHQIINLKSKYEINQRNNPLTRTGLHYQTTSEEV